MVNFPTHSVLPQPLTDREHGWSLDYFKWFLIFHQSDIPKWLSACVFKPQHNLPKPGEKMSTAITLISTFLLFNQKTLKNCLKSKGTFHSRRKVIGRHGIAGIARNKATGIINMDWRGTSSRDVFHHRHSEGQSRKTQQQILGNHTNTQPSLAGDAPRWSWASCHIPCLQQNVVGEHRISIAREKSFEGFAGQDNKTANTEHLDL